MGRYVAASPSLDEQQVASFYIRLGRLLSLLYVLQANDFHYENLIAAGDHPVLIDCESFFNGEAASDAASVSPIAPFVARSVLNTGLLPRRLPMEQRI